MEKIVDTQQIIKDLQPPMWQIQSLMTGFVNQLQARDEQIEALRQQIIKYQQWSFSLQSLPELDVIQRNELADRAEALGCREQGEVSNEADC